MAQYYVFPRRMIDGSWSSWLALLVRTQEGFRYPNTDEVADYVSRDTW